MSYNKVILEGRLASVPEVQTTNSGVEYCNFSVAVDRDYKQGEERQADFINVKAWRNTAKFIGQYFKKGDPILLDGRLEVRNYTDKDGNKRTMTEVVVDKATFTISKKQTSDSSTAQSTAASPTFTDIDTADGELPF